MHRLFVAVRIPPMPALSQVLESLHDVRGVKAVAPENVHYTLRFLGDVDDATTTALRDAFPNAPLGTDQPFDLEVRGVGAFPKPSKPRVVWAGCDDGAAGRLEILARGVEALSVEHGLGAADRAFQAHLTLARVKHLDGRGRKAVDRIFTEHEHTVFGTHHVDTVTLVESELRPEGAIYTDIAQRHLGDTPRIDTEGAA